MANLDKLRSVAADKPRHYCRKVNFFGRMCEGIADDIDAPQIPICHRTKDPKGMAGKDSIPLESKAGLSAERLRQLLDYDPNTGIFRWKFRLAREEATQHQVAANKSWNVQNAGAIAGSRDRGGHLWIRVGRRHYHRIAWLFEHGKPVDCPISHVAKILGVYENYNTI